MKSTAVTMFECGSCHSKHVRASDAESCCICKKCHERPVRKEEHGGWRDSRCQRCLLKAIIRDTQERVRREEKSLASAKAHLAKLQAEYAALKEAS